MNLRVYAAAASGIFRRDLTVYVSYRWRLATQYIGVLSVARRGRPFAM